MPSFAQAKVPLLCASLALMVAVSCSHNASDESPTGPSMPAETGGAVIAGTVVGDQRSVAAHVTDEVSHEGKGRIVWLAELANRAVVRPPRENFVVGPVP